MNVYVWRHNRQFHSFSMIDEPCVQQHFYTDAIAVVMAENIDEALELLADRNEGWRIEDLKRLEPKIYPVDSKTTIFTDVRG